MIANVKERNQRTQAHSARVAIFVFLAPSSFFVVHDDHEPVPLVSILDQPAQGCAPHVHVPARRVIDRACTLTLTFDDGAPDHNPAQLELLPQARDCVCALSPAKLRDGIITLRSGQTALRCVLTHILCWSRRSMRGPSSLNLFIAFSLLPYSAKCQPGSLGLLPYHHQAPFLQLASA